MKENFKEPRFGEQFKIDATNRMEILREFEALPEYIQFSREIRARLKKSIETEGWPERPKNIEGLEDFFNQAREIVSEKWLRFAQDPLNAKYREWLTGIPDDEEGRDLRKILADPNEMEKSLRIRQLGILESLRKAAPEAWRSLVLISSERQLASIALSRHWIKEMPDEEIQKMGANKAELELFIDAAAILGKYIDQAYVKQIELADQPGGSAKTKLSRRSGAEYIYDTYVSPGGEDIDLKPYVDVFPFEFEKIVKRFEALSRKTASLLEKGEIPENYRGLPEYLQQLAEVYGSKEFDPEKLADLWDKLYEKSGQLALADCPIMIIPQGDPAVAGAADKVDIEIRLGFRTNKNKELEKNFDRSQKMAQKIVDANQNKLSEPHKIPSLILNFQPFAFGPNLYRITLGESVKTRIVSHTNALMETAVVKEIPLLQKILSIEELGGLDEKQYQRGTIFETGLHEISHTIMFENDDAVRQRIGDSQEQYLLEELKAETLGMKLLSEVLNENEFSGDLKNQFFAKLGTIFNYLANKPADIKISDSQYFYVGIAMIDKLLNEGVLKEEGGRYKIIDIRKGIEILAQMGEEILEKFYVNPKSTPAKVKRYAAAIIKKADDAKVKRFLEILKR